MRILILSTSMGMGGADQQILILAQAMQARGHEVRIVVLAPLGAMGLEARQAGIPIESLDLRRNLGIVPRFFQLVRMIRAWRPDVLHSHMVHANFIARAARALAPVPILVSTIHSISDGGRLHVVANRLTNRMVDRFTIISRLAADRHVAIGAVPESRLQIIPNAVDISRFRRLPDARLSVRREFGVDDRFVWLAVGRFEAAKDYPNMIAAFMRLLAERPHSLLLLVGEGSLQGDVEQLIQQGGIEAAVRFLGVRRDVPEILSAADGYVLSSAWEGMPVALLEAASVELPVVATRVGGVAEVVEHGSTGFLVPPGDPEGLASAMVRVESLSPDARVAMGGRGRALVEERYGTDRVMQMWHELYSGSRPPRG